MNIGIDARLLGNNHGGIGRYTLELIKHLLEIDRENNYWLFYNEDGLEDIKQIQELVLSRSLQGIANGNVEFVSVNIRHYSLAEQVRLPIILNKFGLDLVHFPNFNLPVLYKKPFVVTIHDAVHHKIGGAKKSHWAHFLAYKKVIENAVKNSRKIITVSEYSKKDIIKYFQAPANKIVSIYEGTSLATNISPETIEKTKKKYLLHNPYFLFVGVLERKKNIVNLTRGFDLFLKKYKLEMDLVIVGKVDRHYPEIKHKALDILNNNRVVFTDYVKDEDLSALYKGGFAFVSASLHEGFGLPGVEAMKFSLPLAVSNIEVFNEIYDNAAVYFNPLEPEDIAEKMHLLARDEQFYQQLQKNSLNRSKFFDWKKTALETLRVYEASLILNR